MVKSKERNGKLENVAEIFPSLLKGAPWGREYKNRLVIYDWQKIVGEQIAQNAKPVKLEFKNLFLKTFHPSWAEQLRYMEHDVIKKITDYMGEPIVNKLVFTNLSPKINSEKSELHRITGVEIGKELSKVNLDDAELAHIKEVCSKVADEELRIRYERFGINVHKMLRYRRQQGWTPCKGEGCASLCPPNRDFCQSCERKLRETKEAKMRQFLSDMPWASYDDLTREIPCTEYEFESQRIRLLQYLAGRVSYGDTESTDAKLLVMLYRSLPPEQLNENVMKKTMHVLCYDVNYVPRQNVGKKKEKEELGE